MPIVQIQTPAIPDTASAEEIILDIIAVKGGRFESKTLLYKAFYLAHLYYWVKHEGVLSHYPIVRMPNGPGIEQGDELIEGLVRSGRITRSVEPYGPYRTEVFTLVESRPIDPKSGRQDAVRDALAFIGTKTAKQVCDEIHEFSRSWRRGASGDELAIYLDLLTDDELVAVQTAAKEAGELLRQALGE